MIPPRTTISSLIHVTMILSSLAIPSCVTTPASPASNPLVGTWRLDTAESEARSTALGKAMGATQESVDFNTSMFRRNGGSILTFTETEKILTTADHCRYEDDYRVKASDSTSITVAFGEGGETTYTVDGDTILVKQPERGLVTVYRRK